MKKLLFILLFTVVPMIANAQNDEDVYPLLKMKIVAQEILNAFQISAVSTSSIGRHISHEWLEDNNIQLDKFKINSYSPTSYEIGPIFDRYVIAQVSGDNWGHLLVFKFINEDGVYRIIPMGISTSSKEYIDPWYQVQQYNTKEN